MQRPPLRTSIPLGIIMIFVAMAFLPGDRDLLPRKYSLRILSYNIHHAEPPSKPGVIDLDAIAKVINDQRPDLVALQEVDVFTRRSGESINQAVELGKKTGMEAYFFKAIDFAGGEYGVAILSKLPVTSTDRYPLPRNAGSSGEPRILATATVQLSAKDSFLFACTHLDAQRDSTDRLLQINAIIGHLRDSAIPTIIAGDFNAVPGSGIIRILDKHFTRTCNPCDYTIPVTEPTRAIDFIAYRPGTKFKVISHNVIPERYASDHLPVLAVLEISY